jgi:hypothetical protein
VYDGSFTAKVREQFTGLAAKAMRQFLADQVNDRLKTALGGQGYAEGDAATDHAGEAADGAGGEQAATGQKRDLETTMEEIEGFQIVRAIACSELAPTRIVPRDTQSYFGILVDDNNRKPLARLHFNGGIKYIGLFDAEKHETRERIESLDQIYKFVEQIRATAKQWA